MMDYDVPVELVERACALTPGLESPTVSPAARPGLGRRARHGPRARGRNRVMDELYDLGARAILITDIHACRL